MGKRRRPSSPQSSDSLIESTITSPRPKKAKKTLADVLLPHMRVSNGRRSSSSSSSSSSCSEPEQHRRKSNGINVDDDSKEHYRNDDDQFDVWLIRKPTTITCEQLSASRLRYPNMQQQLDDDGCPRHIQQTIKVRSDVDSDNEWRNVRRRLICDFDRDKRRRPQMIRVAVGKHSSSSRKHRFAPVGIVDGVVSITEADDHRSTMPLKFKEIQCPATDPPPNVRLFQRTTPFGVTVSPKKKRKKSH